MEVLLKIQVFWDSRLCRECFGEWFPKFRRIVITSSAWPWKKRHRGCSKRRQPATRRQSTTSPNTWNSNSHNNAIPYICRKLQSSLSNKPHPRLGSCLYLLSSIHDPYIQPILTCHTEIPWKQTGLKGRIHHTSLHRLLFLIDPTTPQWARQVYRIENLLHPPKHEWQMWYSQGEERNALYYNNIYRYRLTSSHKNARFWHALFSTDILIIYGAIRCQET